MMQMVNGRPREELCRHNRSISVIHRILIPNSAVFYSYNKSHYLRSLHDMVIVVNSWTLCFILSGVHPYACLPFKMFCDLYICLVKVDQEVSWVKLETALT